MEELYRLRAEQRMLLLELQRRKADLVECMRAALARWKATVQKAGLERLGELDSACAAQLLGTSFDAWRRWQQLRSCRATRPQASTSRARTRMVSRICGREGSKEPEVQCGLGQMIPGLGKRETKPDLDMDWAEAA
ncbi:unnamed protein product [Effrenium voratum]|nr:unnamed protein product [Effrenium voratum]